MRVGLVPFKAFSQRLLSFCNSLFKNSNVMLPNSFQSITFNLDFPALFYHTLLLNKEATVPFFQCTFKSFSLHIEHLKPQLYVAKRFEGVSETIPIAITTIAPALNRLFRINLAKIQEEVILPITVD